MKKFFWPKKLTFSLFSLGMSFLVSLLPSAVLFSTSTYRPRLIKNTKLPPQPLVFKRESQIEVCFGESLHGYKLFGALTKDKEYCAIPELYPWYPDSNSFFNFDQDPKNLDGANKELFHLYRANKGLVDLVNHDQQLKVALKSWEKRWGRLSTKEEEIEDDFELADECEGEKIKLALDALPEQVSQNETKLERMDRKINDYSTRVGLTKVCIQAIAKLWKTE